MPVRLSSTKRTCEPLDSIEVVRKAGHGPSSLLRRASLNCCHKNDHCVSADRCDIVTLKKKTAI